MPDLHAALLVSQLFAWPVLCGGLVALWQFRAKYRRMEARLEAMQAVQGDLLAIRLVAEGIVDRDACEEAHVATLRMLLARVAVAEHTVFATTLRARDRRPSAPHSLALRPGASRA